jgi:hypothetical protein
MDAELIARLILLVLAAYALLGAAVAIAFVTVGVNRVDPAACAAPIAFRLLILPGSIALWPWVLALWRQARRTETAK